MEENDDEQETQTNTSSTAMETSKTTRTTNDQDQFMENTTETTTTKKKTNGQDFMETETTTETTSTTTTTMNNEQDQFVETSRADRLMWLLKCPRMASRLLQNNLNHSSLSSSSSSRPVVGKVVVSVDPCHPTEDASATQFIMELACAEIHNIPRRYHMDMSDMQVPMSVFSVSSQGKVSVEGKILNKMDMKPHEDSLDSYINLCRERTRHYKAKARQIQVIDDDNGARTRPMPGSCLGKKEPTKVSFSRRARKDRREVEEILFKLFERHPNWSFRQLSQETDQPELYLKEILKEICDYNCRGDNQGTYTMKLEYRLAKNETDNAEKECHEGKEEETKASPLPSTTNS